MTEVCFALIQAESKNLKQDIVHQSKLLICIYAVCKYHAGLEICSK